MPLFRPPVALAPNISGAANIREFGARGNGETDDRVAIQRAFDAVADHGGAVYIPPGRYLVRPPTSAVGDVCLYLRGNDIHVFGHGPTSVLYTDDQGWQSPRVSAVDVIWVVGSASRLVFEDFEIRGVNSPFEGTRIWGNAQKAIRHGGNPPSEFLPGNSAHDWTLRRVGFRDIFGHCMYSPGAPAGGQFKVIDCYAENCTNGFNFNVPDVVYENCRLVNANGIETSDQRVSILNCTFIGSNGVTVGGNGNPPSAGPQVIGNRFYNVSGASQPDSLTEAITVGGCTGAIVKGNYINGIPNGHHGITVKDVAVFGVVSGPATIDSNVIITGVQGNHGIWNQTGHRSIITNNYIEAGSRALVNAATDCVVSGNYFSGNGTDVELQNSDRILFRDNRLANVNGVFISGTSAGSVLYMTGTGAPSVTAPNGSTWIRTDGTGPNLYVRENGAWVAK
jgi:hypothetical protein